MGILAIVLSSACFLGCEQILTGQNPIPDSEYTINNVHFAARGNDNTTTRAIEVPCDNNNTIHLYYSPSFNDSAQTYDLLGRTVTLKIVSNLRAGNLKWNECYLEVNTSAIDTWLSTGSDNKTVKVTAGTTRDNDIVDYYEFADVAVQHWTSVPLNEFGKVSGTLITRH